MKCLNCNNEAVGRSKYCGDSCKVAWNRNRKRNTEALIESVTLKSVTMPETVTTAPTTQEQDEHKPAQSTKSDGPGQCIGVAKYAAESQPSPRIAFGRTPSLEDYQLHPDDYCTRQEPERMNWGEWMDMDELRRAGFKCNRTPLLGDWDHERYVADHVPGPPVDESMSKA